MIVVDIVVNMCGCFFKDCAVMIAFNVSAYIVILLLKSILGFRECAFVLLKPLLGFTSVQFTIIM